MEVGEYGVIDITEEQEGMGRERRGIMGVEQDRGRERAGESVGERLRRMIKKSGHRGKGRLWRCSEQ